MASVETNNAKEAAAADENAPSPNVLVRFGNFVKHIWQSVLTAGVIIWTVIFLLFFWSSGVVDNLLPETHGVIHIESPQIYTRERLVNDRFREQAWLEAQLKELEERANLVSSIRKDTIRLSVESGPAEEGEDQTNELSQSGATNGNKIEDELLVSADDSFNLQRNMRATIRRALIENELDDRHDLGSNSLYQFNFGAAIIAGSRTRRIAAIEMQIDPVEPLQPLNAFMPEGSVCAGLKEYECAFLYQSGILSDLRAREQEEIRALAAQYDRWDQLFQKWLGAENAAYEREAEDIRELLQSPQASERIRTQMKPFFNNLNRQAKQYIESFKKVAASPKSFPDRTCRFPDDGDGNSANTAIEDDIRQFIESCIKETNRVLNLVGDDLEGVESFVRQTLLFDPNIIQKSADASRGKLIWGEYFLYVFNQFNEQCVWSDELVRETRLRAPPNSGQTSNEISALGSGVTNATAKQGWVNASPQRALKIAYEISPAVETNLLNCISRSIVRDYGSHPFGKVSRNIGNVVVQSGGEIGVRSDRSTYRTDQGLASIVVTSSRRDFRSRERTEYAGIASRYTTSSKPNGLELYPHKLDRLNRTCAHYSKQISPPDSVKKPSLLAGVSSSFDYGKFTPTVSTEIGWNFLSHFICADHDDNLADVTTPFHVQKQLTIPIGLFRFIDLLSGSQKTFSYSVQPSGAFNLQRREQNVGWSLNNLFGNGKRNNEIAASGDTTESWIEKQYRIIGFGAQSDNYAEQTTAAKDQEQKAKFGWFIFPAAPSGGLLSLPVMESANIKLSALVSLPAWWQNVDIKISTSWRETHQPQIATQYPTNPFHKTTQTLRVELPRRLEFIRNHFPNTTAIRPSLYQLHLPKVSLRACEDADIVLKGERLWRSTVVTLGSQRSTLIQVMPDMRGIIARFEKVVPFDLERGPLAEDGTPRYDSVPVTIWTSEGQKSVVDTVSIFVPESTRKRIEAGERPCDEHQDQEKF